MVITGVIVKHGITGVIVGVGVHCWSWASFETLLVMVITGVIVSHRITGVIVVGIAGVIVSHGQHWSQSWASLESLLVLGIIVVIVSHGHHWSHC